MPIPLAAAPLWARDRGNNRWHDAHCRLSQFAVLFRLSSSTIDEETNMDGAATSSGFDMEYARAFHNASPEGVRRLGGVTALLQHREAVPAEAAYAAQLI